MPSSAVTTRRTATWCRRTRATQGVIIAATRLFDSIVATAVGHHEGNGLGGRARHSGERSVVVSHDCVQQHVEGFVVDPFAARDHVRRQSVWSSARTSWPPGNDRGQATSMTLLVVGRGGSCREQRSPGRERNTTPVEVAARQASWASARGSVSSTRSLGPPVPARGQIYPTTCHRARCGRSRPKALSPDRSQTGSAGGRAAPTALRLPGADSRSTPRRPRRALTRPARPLAAPLCSAP